MRTRGERLRWARKKANYKYATDAARALGVEIGTYNSHERAGAPGARNYEIEDAEKYGRKFKVQPLWLLTGKGETEWALPDPPSPSPPIDEDRLRQAIVLALEEFEGPEVALAKALVIVAAGKGEVLFQGEHEAHFLGLLAQARRGRSQTEPKTPPQSSNSP